MGSENSNSSSNLVQDGIHVHSIFKEPLEQKYADRKYKTPYSLSKDGFSDDFLEDALTEIQHRLFGKWGLIGEKGRNNSYADRCSVYIFGMAYGRGNLSLKTQGLMVLASLYALQRENVSPTWSNSCLNLGWTEEQIMELGALISHISGFPPSRSALMVLDDVVSKRSK